jgi:hypothetical protein
MMFERKVNRPFSIRKGVAEAREDNPEFLLSLDCASPDRVVVFISPEVHNAAGRQFMRNRELDGVMFGASLRSLVEQACSCFEDERDLDRWILVFSKALRNLEEFKNQRRAAMQEAVCDGCGHPATEHYEPNVGDLRCRHEGCQCVEFGPLAPVEPEESASLGAKPYGGLRLVG